MNFFEQQDIARRNTRVLVLLFLVTVLLLIVLATAPRRAVGCADRATR